MLKLAMLALALVAAPAVAPTATIAKPSFSIADTQCKLGLHCVFTITKTGTATSYSDIVFVSTGAAAQPLNITIRFLKADTSKTVADQSLAPGIFNASIKAARYGTIGRGSAIGTVLALTQLCPDGQVIVTGGVCPPPIPPTTQMCPDGSMIPITNTCPITPPPPPPVAKGTARALQACAAMNRNESLIVGAIYNVVEYGHDANGSEFAVLSDASHLGDGYFSLYVSTLCLQIGT